MNVSELISALPQDDGREELERIYADLTMRPVPTGSLHRLWTVGELSVQVALGYGAHRIRGWFADVDAQERDKLETNLRLALKILHRLSYLRGALMKAGQTVGLFPQILPSEIASTLEGLHFDAPPMHYTLIREVLVNELGAEPEELFQSFEKKAFAAASIGQVHRATLKTGEQVAVKIQYPGIARTIDADIRNLIALVLPLRLGRNGDGMRATLEEIHRVLAREADYTLEAASIREAAKLFEGAAGIAIPRVFEEYSGRRVLTMEYLSGVHLPAFLADDPSQELRNAFGTKLCFSWYRMHAAGLIYGDPHSGNYLFMDDGRLGLLDFGCLLRDDPPVERLAVYRALYHPKPGPPDIANELALTCWLKPEELEDESYTVLVDESVRWVREPFQCAGAFNYGNPDYLRTRADWFARAPGHGHVVQDDPSLVYFCRSTYALAALLYQLRAQVDMSDLPFEEWWNWKDAR